VGEVLTPPELELWERLPRHDHHHTVEVARRVEDALAGTAHAGDPRWLAAALLHDIGKLQSGLGIYGRVMATLAGRARPDQADAWRGQPGWRRRVGDYLRHDLIGAEMLRGVGGRPEPAHWAEAHHGRVPVDPAVVPGAVAAVLAEADPD
jgi:putative nucleotidyltransferase with HDIG domain